MGTRGNAWRAICATILLSVLVMLVFAASALADVTRYEENSPSLIKSGTWVNSLLASHSGGAVDYTNDGAPPVGSATFSFTGTGVTYFAAKWYNRGIASVSLDGGAAEPVDLFYQPPGSAPYATSTVQSQQAVYTKQNLANGPHTLTITYTGAHNPLASNVSGYLITIDAFDVTTPDPAVSTPASSPWSVTLLILLAAAMGAVVLRRRLT